MKKLKKMDVFFLICIIVFLSMGCGVGFYNLFNNHIVPSIAGFVMGLLMSIGVYFDWIKNRRENS